MVDSQTSFPRVQLGVNSLINDNYYVSALRLLTQGKRTVDCVKMCQPHWTRPDHNRNRRTVNVVQCHQTGPESGQTVNCFQSVPNVNCLVNHANIVQGQLQRKGVSSAIVRQRQSLKYVNNVSCVDQLCSVKGSPNALNVAQNLPVGARLNQFWKTWEALGAGPKVLTVSKEGYILPFQTRPNLTKSPTIISCYVHPHSNLYLLDALHQLTNKNAVELVTNQESLGF